jgi:hypothetical protein
VLTQVFISFNLISNEPLVGRREGLMIIACELMNSCVAMVNANKIFVNVSYRTIKCGRMVAKIKLYTISI